MAAAVPLTREDLREELAALWSDLQRAINDLEAQVARQGAAAIEKGESPESVAVGDWPLAAQRHSMLGAKEYQPHHWVQRHIRSFAVRTELEETRDGLNETRVTPTKQLGTRVLKGQGPLSSSIRRARTFADPNSGRPKRLLAVNRKGTGLSIASSSAEAGRRRRDARATSGLSEVSEVPRAAPAAEGINTRMARQASQASMAKEAFMEVTPNNPCTLNVPTGERGGSRKGTFDSAGGESMSSMGTARSGKVAPEVVEEVDEEASDEETLGQLVPLEEEVEDRSTISEDVCSPRRSRLSNALESTRSMATMAFAMPATLPVPEASTWIGSMCQRIVHNVTFEYLVLILIIANSATIGAMTDVMARNMLDHVPGPYRIVDTIFSAFFFLELVMRMVSDGTWFWTGSARFWNAIDFAVVAVQIAGEVANLLNADTGLRAMSLMRVLRFLRLVRVIRVMRLLRYIMELRTIVTSLTSSLKPLLSSMLLMFLVVYTVGIYLSQVVLDRRLQLDCSDPASASHPGDCDDAAGLATHFGDLGSSLLSLFQAVTGGVDWGDIVKPLMTQISPIMGIVFSFYILFTALALMNIVTGVFVETALARGREDKDVYMINHLRDLFTCLDVNQNGVISWAELSKHLDNPKLQTFLKEIDLDISEAGGLFKLLDKDHSGMIDADEFLSGCVRLRGPAKALDMQLVMRELGEHRLLLMGLQSRLFHGSGPGRQLTAQISPPQGGQESTATAPAGPAPEMEDHGGPAGGGLAPPRPEPPEGAPPTSWSMQTIAVLPP